MIESGIGPLSRLWSRVLQHVTDASQCRESGLVKKYLAQFVQLAQSSDLRRQSAWKLIVCQLSALVAHTQLWVFGNDGARLTKSNNITRRLESVEQKLLLVWPFPHSTVPTHRRGFPRNWISEIFQRFSTKIGGFSRFSTKIARFFLKSKDFSCTRWKSEILLRFSAKIAPGLLSFFVRILIFEAEFGRTLSILEIN